MKTRPNSVRLPLTDEVVKDLRAGDSLRLSGIMYAGRDASLKRMVEALDQDKALPIDIRGQTIYFMGPTPARFERVVGSAGPTTSGRMAAYLPRLMAEGLKGIIGKGMLPQGVRDVMKRYRVVYFAAVGGTGALICQSIKKAKLVAYEELGDAEALRLLEVEGFPVTVVNDIYGGDLYLEGKARYRVQA